MVSFLVYQCGYCGARLSVESKEKIEFPVQYSLPFIVIIAYHRDDIDNFLCVA